MSQKKARLIVVEVEPKNGSAAKDNRGRGIDSIEVVLDRTVP